MYLHSHQKMITSSIKATKDFGQKHKVHNFSVFVKTNTNTTINELMA